jgi:hypothetical protein
MNKRDLIKQKIEVLNSELKKLEEQEKVKVGDFMLDLYQKKEWDLDKIIAGVAKILGDEPPSLIKSDQRKSSNPVADVGAS